MPAPNMITAQQLARLIGTPVCPTLIDVRIDEDFDTYPHLIPTARRYLHTDIPSLAQTLRGHHAVLVCHKGKKLSQGTAALLRTHGISAEVLDGGMVAWRKVNGPTISPAAIPAPLWVTRHRPKIDRIACPWLIRRFIDPDARILFVPPNDVTEVAQNFGATPFDIPDTPFGHVGPQCSFEAFLDRLNLSLPALAHLGKIIRAADTGTLDVPEAAGLLAISLGLSRQYRDDLKQLDAGMVVYDALYRWARDATDETHVH